MIKAVIQSRIYFLFLCCIIVGGCIYDGSKQRRIGDRFLIRGNDFLLKVEGSYGFVLNKDSIIISKINLYTNDTVLTVPLKTQIVPNDLIGGISHRFFIQNSDSIFFIRTNHSTQQNEILLFNRHGTLTHCVIIADTMLETFNNFPGKPLQIRIVPNPRLEYHNNRLYFGISANIDMTTEKGWNQYYSKVCPNVIYDINNKVYYNEGGGFPEIYRNGNGYRDYYAFRCVLDTCIVYSFGLSDSLYIYSVAIPDKLLFTVNCPSRFVLRPNPVHKHILNDYNSLKIYLLNEFRYKGIYYNRNTQQFYRIASFQTEQEDPGGNFNTSNNFSIIVIDRNFHVIDERKFLSSEYSPIIFPVKNGYFIKCSNTKGTCCYELFSTER